MKHSLKITLWLVVIFLMTQVTGLLIISQYIDVKASEEQQKAAFESLPFDIERPPLQEQTSFVYIVLAILIATVIVLFLIRLKKFRLWKLWFFISVVACMTFAFARTLGQTFSLIVSIALGYWKVFRPNLIIHNLTEIFIYGGLAVIFVPVMNVFAAAMMLLLISAYDMYAVWKSRHMVAIADFQKESKVFAGLYIPYNLGRGGMSAISAKAKGHGVKQVKSAVLGGGDMGFPLIFTGVVMKTIMLEHALFAGFARVLLISFFASIALLILLLKAEKDKYYPAMPFIAAGCFLGYGLLLLI